MGLSSRCVSPECVAPYDSFPGHGDSPRGFGRINLMITLHTLALYNSPLEPLASLRAPYILDQGGAHGKESCLDIYGVPGDAIEVAPPPSGNNALFVF